jgi:two-component system sensor kinase FixL
MAMLKPSRDFSVEKDECSYGQSRDDSSSPVVVSRFLDAEELSLKDMTLGNILQLQRVSNLGEFSAGLIHDITTQISHIENNLLLAEESISRCTLQKKGCAEYLTAVKRATRSIMFVALSLLDYSKYHSISKRDVSLGDIVVDAFSLMCPVLDKRKVRTDMRGQDMGYMVFGDPYQLQQIFVNLLSNACHAFVKRESEENRVSVRIYHPEADELSRIVAEKQKENPSFVAVEVADNGSGMTEDVLSNISKPFFTTRLDSGGTGLGLYLTAALVKGYNGFLKVTTTQGKGSAFTVYLPSVI